MRREDDLVVLLSGRACLVHAVVAAARISLLKATLGVHESILVVYFQPIDATCVLAFGFDLNQISAISRLDMFSKAISLVHTLSIDL